ncbi:hypothetical protein ASG93_04990 [Paenibacillus sp. Soil787]|nr:hypothetical protein ASG93_04990 [Paenibacillus sp. Soil787]
MLKKYHLLPRGIRYNIKQELMILASCFLLYFINQFYFKKIEMQFSWLFKNHFNDVLASLILLSYSNCLILVLKNRRIRSFTIQFIFISVVGLFWEYGSPYFMRSTADILDIFSYEIGFLIYWILMEKSIGKQIKLTSSQPSPLSK